MPTVLQSKPATAPANPQTQTGTGPATPGHRWRAFALLVVAYFITIVDFTIVNVALPTIGRNLHFAESDLQWVVTAYGLTYAGFVLLGGRAADLLGRRRLLMAGVAVFTAASLGGGLATGATFLVVMRGIQGLGAALSFIPVSIGALTGITERDAGVASGLLSTSQNLGGVTALASVAAALVIIRRGPAASTTARSDY